MRTPPGPFQDTAETVYDYYYGKGAYRRRWNRETTMTPKQVDYVRSKIENEGFHYCFVHYSDFSDITDEEFQKLRKAYCDAAEALQEFIGGEGG